MVLRRRADERRPADVDVLDHLGVLDAARRRRALERIEVHAHQVDRLDRVLVDRAHVLLVRADREQAGVDLRVERLHPAVEDLREARVVVHRPRLDAGLRKLPRRAAGRDDLDAQLRKPAREVDETALVGNGQERTPHLYLAGLHHSGCLRLSLRHPSPSRGAPPTSTAPAAISLTTLGSKWCSISWTRFSISSISGWYGSSNASCMMIGPESTPSSTKCTVTPVTRTPYSSACSIDRTPGKGGQERRVDVHDPGAKACNEAGAEDLHEPGEHDELHAVRVEPVGQRLVPRLAIVVVRQREHAGLDTRIARAGERLCIRLVRRHADDLDPVAPVNLVEQRLQVRSGPGCEDGDRKRHDATESTGYGPRDVARRPSSISSSIRSRISTRRMCDEAP